MQAQRFNTVYDDTEIPVETPPEIPSDSKDVKNKVKLSESQQAFVNSLLAQERRKLQTKNDELITQLETIKVSASTTQAEREALESRIESLQNEFATKDEMTKKDTDKKLRDLETKNKTAEARAQKNWEEYEKYRKNNDLTLAAASAKAFNPEQIVLILKDSTKIVEVVGDNGKPTGEYTTRVRLPGINAEGQNITLDLTPPEAVKYLSEKPETYGNLFISTATGGLGSSTASGAGKGGKPDPGKMSTEEYMSYRRDERKGKRAGQR